MTLEEQRAACVEFMGYRQDGVRCDLWDDDTWICFVSDYHPDLDNPASREQAWELLDQVSKTNNIQLRIIDGQASSSISLTVLG